jgi:hypothetical protein
MRSIPALAVKVAGLLAALLLLPGWSGEKPPPAPQKAESTSQAREAGGTQRPTAPAGPAASQGPGAPPGSGAQVLPPLQLEGFAAAPPAMPLKVKPVLRDQATTVDKAANYQAVMNFLSLRLTPAQKDFLNRHKFLLIPKSNVKKESYIQYDEMLSFFDQLGGPESPQYRRPHHARLINPDVFLHAFHKFLENSLEHLEKTVLAKELRQLVQQLQSQALAARKSSPGDLARHYELIAAQLTVPRIILENAPWPVEPGPHSRLPEPQAQQPPDQQDTLANALARLKPYEGVFSPEMLQKLKEELKYIYEANSQGKSPLFGHYDPDSPGDYTQYTPRSHYTKSSLLRAYFRAMMYLGRNYYNLQNPEGVTDALLLAHLLATPGKTGQPLQTWKRIMEITGFYVGLPDDISYPEWRDFIVKIAGKETFAPQEALSPELHKKITAELKTLRPPVTTLTRGEQVDRGKINFRLFGQRFTFDAWMLDRLTAKEPRDIPPFPSTPSALFVPAVLGNPYARSLLPTFLKQEMPELTAEHLKVFEARLNQLSETVAQVEDAAWFNAVGWAWLKLLTTLNASYGQGYPAYMQSPLFPLKQLETFLGSYTELKHDTLLYAKQSYAEMGNGDEGKVPPVPRGLVEPNVAFWRELERLVSYTLAGFEKYGLFPQEREEFGRLRRFKEMVEFCAAMAEKELAGQPLGEKEYEKIRTFRLDDMAEPRDGDMLEEKDKRAALIADIHTDRIKGRVLYEATGQPYVMLVLVGNEGRPRLTVGLAFNHYEFTGPLGRRYTDEDWQAKVYEAPGQLPPKDFWYKDLLVK